MALLNTKVGDFNLGEAFAIGLAKSLSEQLLSGLIGNGTFMSGGIKLIGSWGLPKMMSGQVSKIVATAWAVDGVEDVVNALFKGGSNIEPSSGGYI